MSVHPEIPPPPYPTWLDCAMDYLALNANSTQHAKAELAALRQKLSETEDLLAKATTRQCYIDRVQAKKERDEALAKLAELTAAVHAAATQLEVAESKEGDAPHTAESHFREAVRTIARTLPPATVQHDRGAVWGELREMDRLHLDNAALKKQLAAAEQDHDGAQQALDEVITDLREAQNTVRALSERLAELREAALALGELAPTGQIWMTDSLRYAAWNAKIAELRAEQGGEGKS